MKKCVFCFRSPPLVKISGEHVLRAKLAKVLPAHPKKTKWHQKFFEQNSGDLVQQKRNLPHSPFDSKVNDVCKECNEGWLNNAIEIPAEKYIDPLVVGIPILVDQKARKLLSLWASKTAAVRGLMDPPPRGIPPEHYVWIMRELTPPPFTYVWLGRRTDTSNAQTRHSRFYILSDKPEDNHPAHSTMLAIGSMFLLIVGCGSADGEQALQDKIAKVDSMQVLRLFPDGLSTNTAMLPAFTEEEVYQISSLFVPEHLEAR